MKIASTDLAMQASHAALMRQESSESLRAWRGERPDFEGMQSAIANISEAARTLFSSLSAVPPAPTFPAPDTATQQASAIEAASDAADNDPFLSMIRSMIEMLTGEEVRIFDMQSFSADLRHAESRAASASESIRTEQAGRAGYGIEYDYHAVREEVEQTSFSATGKVRTADGQEFSFTLDLSMSRYYREETHVSVREGDAVRKDPLVVNFGGTAAQLAGHAEQRFRFDLDGDGRAELLPLFASGSGFLALDLDENGRIDSGRELFGPRSGNGFTDLAQLDDDGNGWIDENDASFSKLSVWTPDAAGSGALHSLTELGIGALGLAHAATPFALRGDGNADLGLIRASGVYLTENGQAGSLQEIDLTV